LKINKKSQAGAKCASMSAYLVTMGATTTFANIQDVAGALLGASSNTLFVNNYRFRFK
jgi:hypothetical protein